MSFQFPRISTEQVDDIVNILIYIIQDPKGLDHFNCSYSDNLVETLIAARSKILEVYKDNIQQIDDGSNDGINLLSKSSSDTIKALKDMVKSTETTDAAKVSGTKLLFELVEKELDIIERVANVERVEQVLSLTKELFTRLPDKALADEYIGRLKEIG
jgi:hypothetical protein